MSDDYCYVAADPEQPGAAWAAAVDEPKYAEANAAYIAEWLREGAHVERVPTEVAREMLRKWKQPEKTEPQGRLL